MTSVTVTQQPQVASLTGICLAQVHRQTAGGAWRLEASEGVGVLSAHKALVAAALADVKYDKIVHVREVQRRAQAVKLSHRIEHAEVPACLHSHLYLLGKRCSGSVNKT